MDEEATTGADVTERCEPIKIGVLTSGGDAQGMNAAVRAVVRSALAYHAKPYAILEGWAGAVNGGDSIREMTWLDTSGILPQGGTAIGTARCPEFREYSGRHRAALNLVKCGIDRLVPIGGDGTLSGAEEFSREWPQHLRELVAEGQITSEEADAHPHLLCVGLVGSIDNDLVGTDMTIGADTALHRIIDAIDNISSTAASHQRTFIIEVMGRHCGYLPLMAAVAGGADYVFTPESPVGPGWEDAMCDKLRKGRESGRRESIIVVAEGAIDQEGNHVGSQRIADAFRERTGVDPRITILGHVQRGGSPSAYDRWMPTLLGCAAVQELIEADAGSQPCILGVRHNRVSRIPLVQAVQDTRHVKVLVQDGNYRAAQESRGSSFSTMVTLNETLSTPPLDTEIKENAPRVAFLHAGGLAPGMNTAARAAVRLGIAKGWRMLGIAGSWEGLGKGKIRELGWSDVEGWGFQGGAELGTRRPVPSIEEYYALARSIERSSLDALVVIGGIDGYLAVQGMVEARDRYPAFRIPMILVPASIDNNLPGAELAIGADTAVNNAIWALDRIKESAAASKRCFVTEIMGRKCGYLTVMSGLSSGSEYAYINECPVDLETIDKDAKNMRRSFEGGRRLFLVLINEQASQFYDCDFLATAFKAEGHGLFDVRHSALGHLQQGGSPSPFDRLLATRLVSEAVNNIDEQLSSGSQEGMYIGMTENGIKVTPVKLMDDELDQSNRRPEKQWWLSLLPLLYMMSQQDHDGGTPPHVAIIPADKS